jgi:hypothetical protein
VVDQVRLTQLGLQQFFLALPGRIGDLEPSRCGPDAHPIRLECQDAGIVADGTLPGKASLGFHVLFISVGNLRQDVYGYLSTQREQFFRLVVKQLMERELRENLTAPGLFAHPVAAGVCLLHRLQPCLALVSICIQPDFRCKLQHSKHTTERMRVPVALRTTRYPSPA